MASSFALAKHPALVLAPGAAKATGQHVTDTVGQKARVLLVADPALRALGLQEPVRASIEESGHKIEIFNDLQSDPKESSVDTATKLAHEMDANCVVGLGGGSALDTAKLVAVLADKGEQCSPYRLSQQQLPFRRTGLITLPTTAGTGSETTPTSIISQEDGTKNWFWGAPLKPDVALMDPELTVGLPPFWTFFTGMDALVHSIESRTNRYGYDENHELAEAGIRYGFANLEQAVLEPDNIEARSGMMLAAAYGGLAISNTGCAVAHNIGHALGSIAAIPHGRGVSIALVATLDWTMEGNRAAFDRVGQMLGGRSGVDIAEILHGLATRCSQSLSLSVEEKAKIDVSVLAKDMVADANISMLDATARDAESGDAEHLAEVTLAA